MAKTTEQRKTEVGFVAPTKVAPADTSVAALALLDKPELAGQGFENVTAKDLLIPRLGVLQSLSPMVVPTKPEFNPAAKPGMIADLGMGQLFPNGLSFIACFYAMIYLEWAPRKSGKGLVANHGPDPSILEQCSLDEKKRPILPNGNYIAETATFYGLNLMARGRRCFLPMVSTQRKVAKLLLAKGSEEKIARPDGSEFTPPIYYREWLFDTVPLTNSEGDWYGWRFRPGRTILEIDPSGQLLKDAQSFYEMSRDGLIREDMGNMDENDQRQSAAVDGESETM